MVNINLKEKPKVFSCKRCDNEYPFTNEYFYRDKSRKFGLNYVCKFCERKGTRDRYKNDPELWARYHKKYRKNNLEKTNSYKKKWIKQNPDSERNTRLKYTYGITLVEYNEILAKQNLVCAICRKECMTGKNLCVDHNHNSNEIRGLLCDKCNKGLGCFDDNIELFKQAIKYLED